jgi:hypothetical protein
MNIFKFNLILNLIPLWHNWDDCTGGQCPIDNSTNSTVELRSLCQKKLFTNIFLDIFH